MRAVLKILPGTGRGTTRSVVEGAQTQAMSDVWRAPTTTRLTPSGPPPRAGEEFL
jgi:hypothetical protein